jgi:hypothetical protein
MEIRLTHIDGKLPNLALMRLSAYHKARGDTVHFTRGLSPSIDEPKYDRVYGSAIFEKSRPLAEALKREYPDAIIGGTGVSTSIAESLGRSRPIKLEDICPGITEALDYTIYPEYNSSIGFSGRGCRLRCKFCVVPEKEGSVKHAQTPSEIWRGPGYPKQIALLDNDFFGSPRWEANLEDINSNGFSVSWNQGINIRLINKRIANAISQTKFRNFAFTKRRLYTAWDNLKDEEVVFRGLNYLADAGVPPHQVMVYMLVGFDPSETFDRILYRFQRLRDIKAEPYVMVYEPLDPTPEQAENIKVLHRFRRYANSFMSKPTSKRPEGIPWVDWNPTKKKAAFVETSRQMSFEMDSQATH